MQILPDWVPNIHPIIVHFPIAVLLIAVLVDFFSLIFKEKIWLKYSLLLLYTIGVLSAFVAFLTGREAADMVKLPPLANPVLNEHADMALLTLLFFAVFTLIRIFLFWKGFDKKYWLSITLVVIVLPGIYLLIETAEHGAELVYKYGVGVKNTTISEESKKAAHLSKDTSLVNRIVEQKNGSWSWEPDQNAIRILTTEFKWIRGNTKNLNAEVIKDSIYGNVLNLRPKNGVTMISGGKSLRSIQTDILINLDNFDGSFMLLHHIQDSLNYDFLSMERDQMILGRITNGDRNNMDSKITTFKDWFKFSVVADGRHFRGYVNDKLITHGHGDELPAGVVGLYFEGTGNILIDKIKVQSLK
jgi:uncharacterized membrane protein